MVESTLLSYSYEMAPQGFRLKGLGFRGFRGWGIGDPYFLAALAASGPFRNHTVESRSVWGEAWLNTVQDPLPWGGGLKPETACEIARPEIFFGWRLPVPALF